MSDYLLRTLKRSSRRILGNPLESALIVVPLALGITVNVVLWTLFTALVVRPLPVPYPHELVIVSVLNDRQQARTLSGEVLTRFAQQPVFKSAASYAGGVLLTAVIGDRHVPISIEAVSESYFETLMTPPHTGRLFTASDFAPGGAAVAVLGFRFWQRALGGSAEVVGQTLMIEGIPHTVVGITSPDFTGMRSEVSPDVTLPLPVFHFAMSRTWPKAAPPAQYLIGRVAKGRTLDEAQAALSTAWLATLPPPSKVSGGRTSEQGVVRVESGRNGFSTMRSRFRTPLHLLIGLAALLLVLTWANVAGVLLARSVAGRDHTVVKLALGASPAQLAWEAAVEGCILAILASVVAVSTSSLIGPLVGSVLWTAPTELTMDLTPDWTVVCVAGLVALATALICVAAPTFMVAKQTRLTPDGTSRGVTPSRRRANGFLIVAQVVVSLTLVCCAIAFARNLVHLRRIDPGYDTSGFFWTRLMEQPGGYRGIDRDSYYPSLIENLRSLPGIDSVALARIFPGIAAGSVPKEPVQSSHAVTETFVEAVSPRFIETIGVALLQGRDLLWSDHSRATQVALINEALAAKLAVPSPVGQVLQLGAATQRRDVFVVGVVANSSPGDVRLRDVPTVFRPLLQEPRYASIPILLIKARYHRDLGGMAQARVSSAGREYVRSWSTIDQRVNVFLARERVITAFGAVLAGLALLLAAVGMNGVINQDLRRRGQEIAVRLALGATQPTVVWAATRHMLIVLLSGVILGIPVAMGAGRLTDGLLFETSAVNAVAMGWSIAIVLGLATVVVVPAAVRASGANIAMALRK